MSEKERLAELRELGKKYAEASEYYDEFIEGGYTEMHPLAKKIANQIGKQILEIIDRKPK